MSTPYEPKEHIQHIEVAPRSGGILDQREITIQSFQTTIPFDYAALNRGLESAWLTPQIRFGVFDRTTLNDHDALNVVLGLQDDLSVRAYDYDQRRPLWFSWQDVIVDTVNIRYYKDEDGLLRFKATGGGRRITDERLDDFNSAFLNISKDAVSKRHFDLEKLRELCFDRFVDRLYMLRFSDPSGEEYRSIDHALFQSRQYIDPQAERLHEIQADTQARVESFDSDIDVRTKELASSIQVRFFIRGQRGSLRLRFPKINYKNEPKTVEEQARVFYRLVDVTENTILDADYYTHLPRSLDELDIELDLLYIDMVDLTPIREVLTSADAREQFFDNIDLGEPWQEWQPHLRALNDLLASDVVAKHITELTKTLTRGNPLLAGSLISTCHNDPKMDRVGSVVAHVVADEIQSVPAASRAQVEESLLSWAVDQEQDTWDVDLVSNEIIVLNLRWQITDLSLDVLPAVLWKLIGIIHSRLTNTNGQAGELLQCFDWCMDAAKKLPSNHSKLPPALRLVAEGKTPASVSDAAQVLKSRITNLDALDDQVLDQFGLPLWPCVVASHEDGVVTLRNKGIGIARSLSATPSGTLFSDKEALAPVDLSPGASIELPVSGSPTELDVQFAKYGKKHHIRVPIAVTESKPSPGANDKSQSDLFDWAKQVELWRATQRVLGDEDAPNKGTISKAVKNGDLEFNGESGRKCRVKVSSYKVWITKTKELANDEADQIIDAVMNEIRSRKR